MAGHSKFKNIQHRKGAQDKKRAKIFTKLVHEIITSVRVGGADPQSNPRLRSAMIAARSNNLPKDRIDRAIKSHDSDEHNYFEMRYEGFASGGIAIIVDALTNNKNRTAAEVRSVFSKHGGNLGETGSVSFMFNRVGMIYYDLSINTLDNLLEDVIEFADDVVALEDSYLITTSVENFTNCLSLLTEKYEQPIDSYIGWQPHNKITIDNPETLEKLSKLVETLEDSDDVQRVFLNCEI